MNSDDALHHHLRLYLVLDPDAVTGDPVEATRAALAGGVSMLQLRAKHRTDREILAIAMPLRALCHDAEIPFIMNDRLDLALACQADGVHLGVDDLPLPIARNLGGTDMILGYSPETDEQLQAARAAGATYLGIGPVFTTSSKHDAGTPLGVDEFTRRHRLSGLPAVGIGGITARNASQVIAAGADGVAVVSSILGNPAPRAAAKELLTAVNRLLGE